MSDFKDMEHNLYLALADVARLEARVKDLDMKTGIETVYQENRALEDEIAQLKQGYTAVRDERAAVVKKLADEIELLRGALDELSDCLQEHSDFACRAMERGGEDE